MGDQSLQTCTQPPGWWFGAPIYLGHQFASWHLGSLSESTTTLSNNQAAFSDWRFGARWIGGSGDSPYTPYKIKGFKAKSKPPIQTTNQGGSRGNPGNTFLIHFREPTLCRKEPESFGVFSNAELTLPSVKGHAVECSSQAVQVRNLTLHLLLNGVATHCKLVACWMGWPLCPLAS